MIHQKNNQEHSLYVLNKLNEKLHRKRSKLSGLPSHSSIKYEEEFKWVSGIDNLRLRRQANIHSNRMKQATPRVKKYKKHKDSTLLMAR